MSTSDLFKYLDPTTLGDSSFLSFSSFADLTQSTYDDEYSQFISSFGQVCDSSQDVKRSHTPFQSSPTPPFTCSDVGSDFDYPQNAFSLLANALSPVTPTPCTGDFGIFHTPSKAGPSKLSGPGQPIHHVSQRSTSSSSDWNSPVTPSLTYKSSVDSLATLAPEHDFYLTPSSNTGYGWDDQAYGASSSSSSYPHSAQNSPPSPSPYRVTSNPTLNTNRHHRAIKQITSMPALKEEDQSTAWFDQYINDDTTKIDEGLVENFDWTFPEFGLGSAGESLGTEGTIFEAFKELETKQEPSTNFDDLTNAQFNDPSSSTNTLSYPQVEVEAPSIVPDLSFSSVDDNSEFMQEYNQWQSDNSVPQSSAPSSSWSNQFSSHGGIDPMSVFQQDMRPHTAPDALGMWSDNGNLSVPGPGSMLRR